MYRDSAEAWTALHFTIALTKGWNNLHCQYRLLEHWLSACRNSAGFSACILLSPSLGEGWGLKAVENAACCHRNGAFSQLLVAACNFQRWFEFLCNSFMLQRKVFLLCPAFLCFLWGCLTTVTLYLLQWRRARVVEGAALCHSLLALSF